jgi:sulfur carrier protein
MRIIVNGTPHELPEGITLAQLIDDRLASDQGVAAAVDGAVSPRTGWSSLVLSEGQTVELLTAVQGG